MLFTCSLYRTVPFYVPSYPHFLLLILSSSFPPPHSLLLIPPPILPSSRVLMPIELVMSSSGVFSCAYGIQLTTCPLPIVLLILLVLRLDL